MFHRGNAIDGGHPPILRRQRRRTNINNNIANNPNTRRRKRRPVLLRRSRLRFPNATRLPTDQGVVQIVQERSGVREGRAVERGRILRGARGEDAAAGVATRDSQDTRGGHHGGRGDAVGGSPAGRFFGVGGSEGRRRRERRWVRVGNDGVVVVDVVSSQAFDLLRHHRYHRRGHHPVLRRGDASLPVRASLSRKAPIATRTHLAVDGILQYTEHIRGIV
mmetsp:Transcript_23016/g.48099  ORF Transcript_23016/g.48099 Transcript_23016/m.48099 type:complete len:220 (+) Transcript_23016:864-1523(+)